MSNAREFKSTAELVVACVVPSTRPEFCAGLVSLIQQLEVPSGASDTEYEELLMTVEKPEAVIFNEFIALRQFQILAHHLADQFAERRPRHPSQLAFGFQGVT